MMPFVTEEIWGYLPGRDGLLAVAEFPAARPGAGRPRGRAGRRDRDRAGAPGAALARPGRGPAGRGARSTHRRGARVRLAVGAAGAGRRRAEPPLATIGRSRSSPRPRSTPSRSSRGSRPSASRVAPARSSAASASSPTGASSPRRRRRWSRRSAQKLDRLPGRARASWDSAAGLVRARRRGLSRLAGAAGDAVRARADPQARLGAGDAAAPVRLRPRRRHEREIVGDRDHRGVARGARDLRTGAYLSPHDERLGGADPDRWRGDRVGETSVPRSSGSPKRWRRSTAPSIRATR